MMRRYVLVRWGVSVAVAVSLTAAVKGETIVSSNITADTTWSAGGSPYLITNDITVVAGVRLTVAAGAVIRASQYRRINVDGVLAAQGTPGDRILFTGTTETAGWWAGLRVNNAGEITLEHCAVRYGGYASYGAGNILKWGTGNLTLVNTAVTNSGADGVVVEDSTGTHTLSGCTFSENGDDGIELRESAVQLSSSQFANNGSNGIWLTPNSSFAGVGNTFTGNADAQVGVGGGTITRNVTWDSGGDRVAFLVQGDVTVGQGVTLTVTPGTAVKFDRYRRLNVDGVLDARGTAGARICFTDCRDDTVGGDSNNDGDATAPDRGWWAGLRVTNAGAGILEFCTVRYGGYSSYGVGNILKWGTGNLTITNTTVAYSGGDGLYIEDSTGVHTLSGCTFTRNDDDGIELRGSTARINSTAFLDNSSSGLWLTPNSSFTGAGNTFTGNLYAQVGVGWGTITRNVTWDDGGDGFAFLVSQDVTVGPGTTLTVTPGTTVKFDRYRRLNVDGVLDARGTVAKPICFTDCRDDTVGGDSNNDGATTAPDRGWWAGLRVVNAGAITLEHCVVRYGGYSSYGAGNILKWGTGNLTITNTTVAYSGGDGLYIEDSTGTHTLSGCAFTENGDDGIELRGSVAQISSSMFANNGSGGVWLTPNSSFTGAGNTFTGNADAQVGVGWGTITRNVTWDDGGDGFAFLVSEDVTVGPGTTLTVTPGTTVKFDRYRRLNVDGVLDARGTVAKPICFTDYRDDSIGGDSNSDHGVAQPEIGWWAGLRVNNAGTAILDRCALRYAGYSSYGAAGILKSGSGNLTLTNSVVAACGGNGLEIDASTGVHTIDTCAFQAHSANGVRLRDSAVQLRGCTFRGNGAYGVYLATNCTFESSGDLFAGNGAGQVGVEGGTITGNVTWDNGGDGFPFVVDGDLTVAPGGKLTVRPGGVVKFTRYRGLYVDGTLEAQGIAAAPLFFTDHRDDTVGGDSNNDGTATVPDGGWWHGLVIRGNGSAVLDYCTVRYGGYSGSHADVLVTDTGSLTLANSTLAHSGDKGLAVESSTVQLNIRNATFTGNGTGLYFVRSPAGVRLLNAKIMANRAYGINNESTTDVDARDSWWGDATGPYHATGNPGGKGNEVSDHVLYNPWKTAAASSHIQAPMRSGTIVAGDTLNFIGQQPRQGGYTYLWSLGDGRTSTAKDPGLIGFAGGTGDVVIEVTFNLVDAAGHPDPNPDKRTFTVKPHTGSYPDLHAVGLDLPASLNAGQAYALNYTVTNIGNAAVPGGKWQDALYLSADRCLDDGDLLLAATAVARTVAVGGTYQGTLNAYMPPVSGQSFLILSIDNEWQVIEEHRLNNELALATSLGVTVLASGVKATGTLAAADPPHYYRFDIAPGESLQMASAGEVVLYLRSGTFPTLSTFDYRRVVAGGGQFVLPGLAAGTWYVMVVPDTGKVSTDYEIEAAIADFILADVQPRRCANTPDIVLTLAGAGFGAGAAAELVAGNGMTYAAAVTAVDTFTRITATFPAGTVPAGVYGVRLAQTGKAGAELAGILTVVNGGRPELKTDIIVPGRMGYHQVATIYVEYANVGDAPMPAPLLILSVIQAGRRDAFMTLDKSLVTKGFWTSARPRGFSNAVEILATGVTAGVLQPGESRRVPVYYAGWQQPWDTATYPPFEFDLSVLATDDERDMEWDSLKDTLHPDGMPAAAWDMVWNNYRSQVGNTVGDFVRAMDADASYLSRLGEEIVDVEVLRRFSLLKAGGLNVVPNYLPQPDLELAAPGLPLSFSRAFPFSVAQRQRLGPLGRGWFHTWEVRLAQQADGTVHLVYGNGTARVFQPDSRGGYFSAPGDYAVLAKEGAGFVLTERNGTAFHFDSTGKQITIRDRNGNAITVQYQGDLPVRLVHSDGKALSIVYNGESLISEVTDSYGRRVVFTYDGNRQLTAVSDPAGRATHYAYGAGGRAGDAQALTQVTAPGGVFQYFQYDGHGRLSGVSRNGNATRMTIGFENGCAAVTDAQGNATRLYFNHLGRIAKVTDAAGNSAYTRYSPAHELVGTVDPTGATCKIDYDGHGNLCGRTDPLGNRLTYSYDPDNRLRQAMDANGNLTDCAYDDRGNLTTITYADGAQHRYEYNQSGRASSFTNARGGRIAYTYGATGNLARIDYPDGTRTGYEYDAKDRLVRATNENDIIELAYDGADQLSRVSHADGRFLEYTYYADSGWRATMRDHTGKGVNYYYDAIGRLARLTDAAGVPVVEYQYDAGGRLQRKTFGNGVYTVYDYAATGRLRAQTTRTPEGNVMAAFGLTYDANGQLTAKTTSGGVFRYEHDLTGSVTKINFTPAGRGEALAWEITRQYDPMGFPTRITANGTEIKAQTDVRNQYTQIGDITYGHDADGNLTTQTTGGTTFTTTHNQVGQPVAGTDGQKSWSARYDPLGMVTSFTSNGTTQNVLYDQAANPPRVAGTYDGSGKSQGVCAFGNQLEAIASDLTQGEATYLEYDPGTGTPAPAACSGKPADDQVKQFKKGGDIFEFETPWGEKLPAKVTGYVGGQDDFTFATLYGTGRIYAGEVQNYTDNRPNAVAEVLRSWTVATGSTIVGVVAEPLKIAQTLKPAMGYTGSAMTYLSVLVYIVEMCDGIERYFEQGNAPEANTGFTGGDRFWHGAGWMGITAYSIAGTVGGVSMGPATWAMSVFGLLNDEGYLDSTYRTFWNYYDGLNPEQYIDGLDAANWAYLYLRLHNMPLGRRTSRPAASQDPNEKTGPGFGRSGHVRPDLVMPYRIDFENERQASAPAQVVAVTDRLAAQFDWDTFELTEVGFGDHVISVPAQAKRFAVVEPMNLNGKALEVQIDVTFDPTSGELAALFSTTDPETGLPPEVDYGFLPPEDGTGRGKGYLGYLVRLRQGLTDGAQVRNVAAITFDFSRTIATNQVDPHDPGKGTDPAKEALVTIDSTPPASGVAALPAVSPLAFSVAWSGSDAGAGVAS